MKKRSKAIVFSADALVYDDIQYLLNKPRFKELYESGSAVKTMRTIYPTVTYPAHTTMSTGVYPDKHGIVNNFLFVPGQATSLPWEWFADSIKTPDMFTAMKKAGLSTASVFWPVTGNHKYIDYLIAEYWPQSDKDTIHDCFTRAGTSEELYSVAIEPFVKNVKIRKHPETDELIIKASCSIIENYKPDFLALHTGDVDSYRHKSGVFSPMVTKGVDDTERFLYELIEATKRAGVFEQTNFFLISDHGQMDIVRSVKLNVIFAENNLIKVENGVVTDWDVWCHSAGMSAQIILKDPNNKEIYDKTYALLNRLCEDGVYGISKVYTTAEAKVEEHLDGPFSFVVETDGYTTFADDFTRPLVKQLDFSDYRYGKATHGYHPEKGPQPIFFAFGPDIKKGVVLERRPTVDEAPTYAKILGAEMPWADGSPIDEIIK